MNLTKCVNLSRQVYMADPVSLARSILETVFRAISETIKALTVNQFRSGGSRGRARGGPPLLPYFG